MDQRLSKLQVQKQILSPVMQRSITILTLPITELNQAIETELQDNPFLESEEDMNQMVELPPEGAPTSLELMYQMAEDELPDKSTGKKEEVFFRVAQAISLSDYLLQQLRIELSDPEDIRIGEVIIGNINDNGYLTVSLDDIAGQCGLTETGRILRILSRIQTFDPPGVGARDIKECLAIQLDNLEWDDKPLALQIIQDHWDDLAKKRFDLIARRLSISTERTKHIFNFISGLEPKPARNFFPINTQIYVKPDLFVVRQGDGLEVKINSEGVPLLKISPLYRAMLRKENLTDEERAFLKNKMESAVQFIRSIRQRETTLRNIAEDILRHQQRFFEMGPVGLCPLTLKDVAGRIDRDESTVSRTIRNKYMDTPMGIFPMKFFFSNAVAMENNGKTTSRGIKEELKELINGEDKTKPLSDQAIVEYFRKKGMILARRTVAKYRQNCRISPSHLRKE